MTSILDHFSKHPENFEPSNVTEFTILQIGRKIGNVSELKRSMIAAERHSLSNVIGAFKKAMSKPDPSLSFQNSLKQLTEQQ